MSGTNRTQPPITGGPHVILIEPQLGEISSSSSLSVAGPDTQSPVSRLRQPRLLRPCCTVTTWRGYQVAGNVQKMPPWWFMSR